MGCRRLYRNFHLFREGKNKLYQYPIQNRRQCFQTRIRCGGRRQHHLLSGYVPDRVHRLLPLRGCERHQARQQRRHHKNPHRCRPEHGKPARHRLSLGAANSPKQQPEGRFPVFTPHEPHHPELQGGCRNSTPNGRADLHPHRTGNGRNFQHPHR